ncbi:MAG TPA: S8 family serine peptidase [Planctomycetota bacterium]
MRNRGYNLHQALQAIRQAAPALRPGLIAGLRQLAQADQVGIAQAVVAAGGVVSRHYWHLSALAVEIPPAAVPVLQQLPRVRSVWPVKAHPASDAGPYSAGVADGGGVLAAPIPPMANSVDAANHNVVAAWSILGAPGNPYRGAGARVAVFDGGIDKDINDGTPVIEPHPAFLVAGSPTLSRVVAHLQADSLNGRNADINILTYTLTPTARFVLSGPPYTGATSGYVRTLVGGLPHARQCGHGTAMAAIVAGGSYTGFAGHGHAPDAEIVDVACSSYPSHPVTGAPLDATYPWVFTDTGHLGAVEELRQYILQGSKVHVVCLSLSGQPSPNHPISQSYDLLARDEDILLVTAAGNEFDTTLSSNGFYHGVAVGSVHARVTGNPPNLSFVPMPQSSRGPLLQNAPGRFYPDLCATGAGIGHFTPGGLPEYDYPTSTNWFVDACISMPGVDMLSPAAAPSPTNEISPVRPAFGTSEAAAQVAGAATLYRGYVTSATAEETRAALLLSVIGTYSDQNGGTSDPARQHTYTGRNTFGVGYLRDDLLALFAKRDPTIEPLTAVVTLTSASPSDETTLYTGLNAGRRYAAVACWRRSNDMADGTEPPSWPLANVRLEIVDHATGNVIALSDSPANSYERVVFLAPNGGTVRLRVATTDVSLITPPLAPLDVQLVASTLKSDVDPVTTNPADHVLAASGAVEVRSAGSGCTATDRDWVVDRIVPYNWAYGSAPFQWPAVTVPPIPAGGALRHLGYARGFDLGSGRASHHYYLHVQYQRQTGVMEGPMVIRGIAFRTWEPLIANNLTVEEIWLGQRAWYVTGTFPLPSPSPPNNDVPVVPYPGRTIGSPAAAATGVAAVARGPEDFNIVVPFDTPFSYDYTQPLHMWIKVQSATAPVLMVDGTDDGPGQPVESHTVALTSTTPPTSVVSFLRGQAPVIGLIADSPMVTRELRLVAHGEPWSASSAGPVCNFDVHVCSGLPVGTPCFLFMGTLTATPSGSPCMSWLTSPVTIGFGPTDTHGMLGFHIPVAPGLVHSEFGLQAALFPGSGGVFTNALRVHVGGGL